MIHPRKKRKPKIGVFGIGLAAYWPQFKGLKETLEDFQSQVEHRITQIGGDVITAGLIDTAPRAADAGELFRQELVDLVICYVGTYATSSQVLPAVQRVGKPVLILNLQPVAAIDYAKTDTHKWLENCCACCVPEISCAFARCDIGFHVVTGMLSGDHPAAKRAWTEIEQWIKAASVAATLHTGRTGFLGHTYPGMLDMYSDFTMLHGQLGMHIEVLEMCDLASRVEQVSEKELKEKLDETKSLFTISEDSPSDPLAKAPKPEELDWAARVSCGLDRLVKDLNLDALTYYYRGLAGNEYERLGAGLILGNTLLTAKGYPCSGEGDLKTCMAMLIMDCLGAGGSYTEFYSMDFNEDFVLMGHDGPAHIAISSGKPILRGLGLYHGKRGYGVSVEMSVKYGPITIAGMTQTRQGNLKLLVAEGESIRGPILRIGNTNSRLKFNLSPIDFMNQWCAQGPTHHVGLGVGHVKAELKRVCDLMHLEMVTVG
jgi:L-arabinose isomerase